MSTVAAPSTAYTTITAVRLSMTPPLVVAAAEVVMSWYTTHGWRPTSVTIQPHSIAASAAGPQSTASHQNHDCRGRPRRRRHTHRAHSPARSSTKASPTMASKDRWISVSAGGRSAAATESRPVTRVDGLKPTRSESASGIGRPK